MYIEKYDEDLAQELILTEMDLFPVLRLEEEHKSNGLHNLKASEGCVAMYG